MASTSSSRAVGAGRVLIAVYGVLALAATARSTVQIIQGFDEAPVAYLLSAAAALVYIVATVALIGRGRVWYRVALVAIVFELLGVIAVGTLSLTTPQLFAHPSVWSWFGAGYVFIPLVLPVLGLLWLAKHRPTEHRPELHRSADASAPADASANASSGATTGAR